MTWFASALAQYPRLAIAGGPKTGKTTLSRTCTDRPIIHTDDYMDMEWSEASEQIVKDANGIAGPVLVEGVRVPHALRKGLDVYAVVWLDSPFSPLNARQESMAKATLSVYAQWRAKNKHVPIVVPNDARIRNMAGDR